MSLIQSVFKILSKSEPIPGVFDMQVLCPQIALAALPGQFLHIACPGYSLRRPISICESNAESGAVRFVLEVRGKGTNALAKCNAGESLDIMGPCGNGFSLLDPSHNALLVAGGIGAPPLLWPAKHYAQNAVVLLGFKKRERIILENDFLKAKASVKIATEDGSAGHQGYVTELIEREISMKKFDIIYSCGPLAMQKAVADIAGRSNIRCLLSLEERMGCGVGACLTCVCKTRRDGEENYDRVCKDGPVFESVEVLLDE